MSRVPLLPPVLRTRLALALFDRMAAKPELVESASPDTLFAICCRLDRNGDFDTLTPDQLREVVRGWVAEDRAP